MSLEAQGRTCFLLFSLWRRCAHWTSTSAPKLTPISYSNSPGAPSEGRQGHLPAQCPSLSHTDNTLLPHKTMYSEDQDVGMVRVHHTAPHTGPHVGCTGRGEGHLTQGAMGSVNTVKITWPCPTSIRTFRAGGQGPPFLGGEALSTGDLTHRSREATRETPPHVWFLTCSQMSSWLTGLDAVILGRPVCKV